VHRVCFKLDGDTVRVPIPMLLGARGPLTEPDLAPLREIIDNWILPDGPTPRWKIDLPILATIAALAELAENPALAEALADVSRFYTDKFAAQLPEGMTVEIAEAARVES
jgi:hypothetical protein